MDENRNQLPSSSSPDTDTGADTESEETRRESEETRREAEETPKDAEEHPMEQQFADMRAYLDAAAAEEVASEAGSLGSLELEIVMGELEKLHGLDDSAQDEAVPPVPRQVSAVKADLIAFSPGKELLEAVPPVPQPDVMPAPALPKSEMLNLNSPQLHDALKKQELHFQDLLLKRDLAENATQEQNAKLKQQVVGLQAALQKSNKVLEMYSATMVRLAAEKESQRDDLTLGVKMLTSERDEAREEVANIEAMFADLHRKYEKSKTMMQENRRQADAVSNSYRTALEENNRERQRYDLLQQHAEDTLQQLREDVEVAGKTQETEMLRMSAKLQLSENRATKLERENQEVTAICDELIQKMGGR